VRGVSALPVVAAVAGGCLLAWVETGSIDAGDWLIYAVFAALLLARLDARWNVHGYRCSDPDDPVWPTRLRSLKNVTTLW
jgi:hypothetical protein